MKIAILHEMCVKIGGAEKVVQALLWAYPEADLFTLILDTKRMGTFFGERQITTPGITQRIYSIFKNQRLCLPFMARGVESLDFSQYDVVIASSSGFAHGAITKPDTKFIVYSHAPARYLWDFTNEYKKQIGMQSGMKSYFLNKLFLQLRQWDYMAAQRADIILANSVNTKKRIQKYHRRESQVLYPPIEVARFQKADVSQSELLAPIVKQNYYIIISALTGFKRIDVAIEWFNQMPDKKLFIIGAGEHREALENQVQWENIQFLWAMYGDDLVELVQNSSGLVFPGEEDFGMVPVEVLAAGKPIFALGKGGLLETVIAGKTWEFFQATQGTDFVEQFEIFDTQNTAGKYTKQACQKSSEAFSEENFLKQLQEIINS